MAEGCRLLSLVADHEEDRGGALAYAEEGLARARSAHDTYQIAWMSVRLGVASYLTGDLERAEQMHSQAMEHFRERGDVRLFALAEGCLADVVAKRGELLRALTLRKDGSCSCGHMAFLGAWSICPVPRRRDRRGNRAS